MFQSTHSRGVRHGDRVHKWVHSQFQSTHSRGVRRRLTSFFASFLFVSIHALTRSATLDTLNSTIYGRFQSTHSRGVRLTPYHRPLPSPKCFNPRTHEECDSLLSWQTALVVGFNPRTHEECDTCLILIQVHIHVSIHALTRSATTTATLPILIGVFQSTHSRGVRQARPVGCLNSF